MAKILESDNSKGWQDYRTVDILTAGGNAEWRGPICETNWSIS